MDIDPASDKPLLTERQAYALMQAIDKNFAWAASKGCTVSDPKKFVKNIIRRLAGLEKWGGEDDPLA